MLIKLLYPSPRRSPDHALGRYSEGTATDGSAGRYIFVHVVGVGKVGLTTPFAGVDGVDLVVAFVHIEGDLLAGGRVGRTELGRVVAVGDLGLAFPTGVNRVDLGGAVCDPEGYIGYLAVLARERCLRLPRHCHQGHHACHLQHRGRDHQRQVERLSCHASPLISRGKGESLASANEGNITPKVGVALWTELRISARAISRGASGVWRTPTYQVPRTRYKRSST